MSSFPTQKNPKPVICFKGVNFKEEFKREFIFFLGCLLSEVNPDEEVMNLIKATIPESKHYLFDKFVRIQDITDVHSGNVLFRNDTVVICDYAGWC